jgi:hypothetical protein
MPQTHIPLCANPLFSDILSLLEPPRLDTVSFEPVLAPSISPASPASPYSFEPTQRNKQQRSPYPPLFVFLSCSLSHLFCTTKPDIPEILEMTKQFNIFYPNSQMPTGLSRQEGRGLDVVEVRDVGHASSFRHVRFLKLYSQRFGFSSLLLSVSLVLVYTFRSQCVYLWQVVCVSLRSSWF